jgi:hypothetical protein
MVEKVKVWFDPEGDFLEVRFSDAPGHMRETEHEALMERVDEHGQVVGLVFSGLVVFVKSVLSKRNWPAISETIDFDKYATPSLF